MYITSASQGVHIQSFYSRKSNKMKHQGLLPQHAMSVHLLPTHVCVEMGVVVASCILVISGLFC